MNKKKIINLPYIDNEEKEIIESIEREEWKSVKDFNNLNNRFIKAAKNSNNKKAITIRINEKDLYKIKVLAEKKGVPYQTLIGSIIHEAV